MVQDNDKFLRSLHILDSELSKLLDDSCRVIVGENVIGRNHNNLSSLNLFLRF